MRGRLLGYPTSVVEGVGDEYISVRETLINPLKITQLECIL